MVILPPHLSSSTRLSSSSSVDSSSISSRYLPTLIHSIASYFHSSREDSRDILIKSCDSSDEVIDHEITRPLDASTSTQSPQVIVSDTIEGINMIQIICMTIFTQFINALPLSMIMEDLRRDIYIDMSLHIDQDLLQEKYNIYLIIYHSLSLSLELYQNMLDKADKRLDIDKSRFKSMCLDRVEYLNDIKSSQLVKIYFTNTIKALNLLMKDSIESFIPYIHFLIPLLIDVLSMNKSPEDRYLSCQCLFYISKLAMQSYTVLYPMKKRVLKGLGVYGLNDKKRVVRMLAAKVRNEWSVLGSNK